MIICHLEFPDRNASKSEGMIEIGGKIHTRIKREAVALYVIDKFKPKKEEWTLGQLQNLGKKIEKLLK